MFVKATLTKSDGQTIIYKYRLTAHFILRNIGTLSTLQLTVLEIIMVHLKPLGQFKYALVNAKSDPFWMEVRTDPNHRKALLLRKGIIYIIT